MPALVDGPPTFQQVIDNTRSTLNDDAKVRYPDEECYRYAIDGMRELCLARPDLFTVTGQITCVAGVKQTISGRAWFLVDVFGVEGGNEITEADYEMLRSWDPNWRNATAGPAQHFMRFPVRGNGREKNNEFFVTPPAAAGQVLNASWVEFYSGDLDITQQVLIPVQYVPAIKAYIIYRCESKDDEFVNNGRAVQFRAVFNSIIGVGEIAEVKEAA